MAPPSPPPPAPGAAGLPQLRSVARRALAFALVFMLLQALWEEARGGSVERLWVDDLTVGCAVFWIQLFTPGAQASAEGARIVAPGGGLNVLLGCEGADVWFLLAAAFMAFRLPWRVRVTGLVGGLAWVWLLNQARIVSLFYAFQSERGWFDLLHTTGAPLVMIVLTGLYFHWWLGRGAARELP